MPLPLAPLLFGAGSLALSSLGVERGLSGRRAFLEARRICDAATGQRDAALQQLQVQRRQTSARLADLGQARLDAWDGPVRRFIRAMRALKHVNVVAPSFHGSLPSTAVPDFAPLDVDFRPIDALQTAVAAGAAGGLSGLAALGGVGTFGVASTGASIGTLSGVAATNATLAWFGGGALSAGGLGMAGGQVVLGGVFAGPLLCAGGLVIHARGKTALEEAQTYRSQVRQAVAHTDLMARNAAIIATHAETLREATRTLVPLFAARVSRLEAILARTDDFRAFSPSERAATRRTVELALLLKELLDLPLFDGDGRPSDRVTGLAHRVDEVHRAPEEAA